MSWSLTFNSETKALIDSIYNPIIAINAGGAVIFINQAAENLLRRPVSEVIGRPITNVITNARLHHLLQTGKEELVQKIDIDGRVYMSNRTLIEVDGEAVGAVAVLQDVSDLEAISTELEYTKLIYEELNAIIESSYDGMYVTDGQARTLRVNKAYERITGLKREEVIGRSMADLVGDGVFNESVTLKVLETRRPTSLVQKVKTGKTVMVTGNPIFDKSGGIRLVVTNVRDVTELHRLQQKLEKMDQLQSEVEMELQQLRETLLDRHDIVLRSKKMKELRTLAQRLSQVESTILVQGESGSGKEVFTDMVHNSGPRRNKPFIKMSCAAFPEHLLESELFGYAPGAFTGARKQGKAGLFEIAQGGTVFLDEIGEMPLPLQAKLLRVLQEREIYRIGDTAPIKIDVRIIAATNRNLEQMVEIKQFRKDLFFRLNVVNVVIPPLRERPESILPFVYHFLDKYNRQYGLSKQVDREVINLFYEYDWPGNVRELENLIERLVVTAPGEVITLENLPGEWGVGNATPILPSLGERPLKEIMDDVERTVLERTVQKHNTTRSAARALGVDQSTIVRKLKRHGIRMDSF